MNKETAISLHHKNERNGHTLNPSVVFVRPRDIRCSGNLDRTDQCSKDVVRPQGRCCLKAERRSTISWGDMMILHASIVITLCDFGSHIHAIAKYDNNEDPGRTMPTAELFTIWHLLLAALARNRVSLIEHIMKICYCTFLVSCQAP